MKNIPSKIFLVVGDDVDNKKDDFQELDHEFVTWSDNRIYETDIPYTKEVDAANKDEAFWKKQFLKVVDNWYNKESPFMEKPQFIRAKEYDYLTEPTINEFF